MCQMVPIVLKVQNPKVKAVHAYWFSIQFLYLVILTSFQDVMLLLDAAQESL